MSLPLKRGEYSSPFFKTELNESYQIEINWDGLRGEWKTLNLDWKLVDDNDALLQKGTYNYQLRGNTAALGHYKPRRPRRQRIIVRIIQDVQGLDLAKLEISLPERGLEMAYGAIRPLQLALLVAGPGILILLSLLIAPNIRLKARSQPRS